jgi:hypothetical protein
MNWLLLVLTLPTENASARMRAWRALKACGAAVLRDGVYVLPPGEGAHARLSGIAGDILDSGGVAHLLEATGEDFSRLFDRSADYARLAAEIDAARRTLDGLPGNESTRLARKLARAYEAIAEIDYFPGEAGPQVRALLDGFEAEVRRLIAPDEPTPGATPISRLDARAYRRRLWATRARPWVDRLASAWLIGRFVDKQARFLWLDKPADCPDDALGFDFDGATFSHVGERVTFETLMASFDLERDPALMRLARVVHCLDVGGLPMPEAAGLEALLAGMRARLDDDDALLAAACQTFDYLYIHYQQGEPTP